MSDTAWDRKAPARRDRDAGEALRSWIDHEVRPFSPWWENRLDGLDLTSLEGLRHVPILGEDEAAAAGGPGNPALLVLPTEDGFKRHADRGEVMAAAREIRKGGKNARRAALYRRYQPVHIHEAGVAVVLAIAYTRSDIDRLHLAGARLVEVLGLGADDAMVNVVPAGPSVRFWGLYHAALAARMTALHPRTGGEHVVGAALRGLAMLPATVLAVPVDEALELLSGLAERRTAAGRLRTVLTVGPPPSTDLRTQIAQAAQRIGGDQVRVQAVWAPDCARVLWGEPRQASADPAEATYGLHTYPDLEVLEVRDVEADRLAAEQTPGELLYTSLGWRGTVAIRLATGAWTGGLVRDIPCPVTGRTVPRLAPAAADGAWQPRVDDGSGRKVRADLRRAPRALRRAGMDARVHDWSLRAVDGRLVLGLNLATDDHELAMRLGQAVADAVGAVPEVHLGERVAARRPRLGSAGVAS